MGITVIRNSGAIIKATFHVNFGMRILTGNISTKPDNLSLAVLEFYLNAYDIV